MYRYFVCAVCPVKAPTLELRYDHDLNEFHPGSAGHIALAPELGFLYPAFDSRAANIYDLLFYSKNPAELHQEVIDALFRVEPPMSAAEQKNVFDTALTLSLIHISAIRLLYTCIHIYTRGGNLSTPLNELRAGDVYKRQSMRWPATRPATVRLWRVC